jgi:hypothetical protein
MGDPLLFNPEDLFQYVLYFYNPTPYSIGMSMLLVMAVAALELMGRRRENGHEVDKKESGLP